jgi:hypothetical protein
MAIGGGWLRIRRPQVRVLPSAPEKVLYLQQFLRQFCLQLRQPLGVCQERDGGRVRWGRVMISEQELAEGLCGVFIEDLAWDFRCLG